MLVVRARKAIMAHDVRFRKGCRALIFRQRKVCVATVLWVIAGTPRKTNCGHQSNDRRGTSPGANGLAAQLHMGRQLLGRRLLPNR